MITPFLFCLIAFQWWLYLPLSSYMGDIDNSFTYLNLMFPVLYFVVLIVTKRPVVFWVGPLVFVVMYGAAFLVYFVTDYPPRTAFYPVMFGIVGFVVLAFNIWHMIRHSEPAMRELVNKQYADFEVGEQVLIIGKDEQEAGKIKKVVWDKKRQAHAYFVVADQDVNSIGKKYYFEQLEKI